MKDFCAYIYFRQWEFSLTDVIDINCTNYTNPGLAIVYTCTFEFDASH